MSARWWLGAIVASALVVRVLTVGRLPLSGDEAYHWEWSRHLAGAYYDHPGMAAWCIWVATRLLGDGGELAVRLPAVVGSAVAALVAYGFARDVARTVGPDAPGSRIDRAGLGAAALITFLPLPAAFGVYMSTDAPLLPVCLGLGWAVFAAAQRGRVREWLSVGALAGLALATKLLVLPLLGAAVAWFVCTPTGRGHLRRRGPWLALAATVVAATPFWWWNATHDWMTVRFNFDIRQRDQVASPVHPLVFVGGQLGVLTPGIAIMGAVAAIRGVRASAAGVRVIAWMCVLTVGTFFAMSMRRAIGMHWTMPAWGLAIVLAASGVGLAEAWTRSTWARWAWRSSWGLAALALLIAHGLSLTHEWWGRQQIVGEQPARLLRPMFGWRELGQLVDQELAAVLAAQHAQGSARGVFVAADQYGVAAAVAFYAPSQPEVHLWSGARHGRNYEFWDDWAALAGQDVILVSKRPLPTEALAALHARCAAVEPAIELPVAVNQFYVTIARRFDGRRPFAPP